MLKDLLDNQPSIKPLLPISHITDWHSVENIAKCGYLSYEESEDKCICFFYGAPLYKVKSPLEGAHALGLIYIRPIGLVFKSNLINMADKMYPFDSGAYSEHFKPYFPNSFDLSKFEISPVGEEELGKLVSLLFGNNDNYIFGTPAPPCRPVNSITDGLYALYSSKEVKPFDERNHGIELQYFKNVFIKDNIELIVFPRTVYLENKDAFSADLNQHPVEFYEDAYRFDPEKDSALIQAKVKEYLRKSYASN